MYSADRLRQRQCWRGAALNRQRAVKHSADQLVAEPASFWAGPGALDLVCHQPRELPRARDFTAGFAQVRGSPAGAPKRSHRILNQAGCRTETEALSQHHCQRKNLADRIGRICFRAIMSGSMIGLVNRAAVRSVAGPKSQAARSGQNADKLSKSLATPSRRDDDIARV